MGRRIRNKDRLSFLDNMSSWVHLYWSKIILVFCNFVIKYIPILFRTLGTRIFGWGNPIHCPNALFYYIRWISACIALSLCLWWNELPCIITPLKSALNNSSQDTSYVVVIQRLAQRDCSSVEQNTGRAIQVCSC